MWQTISQAVASSTIHLGDAMLIFAQGPSSSAPGVAPATGEAGPAASSGGGAFTQILFFVGIFAVFYFLIIRPQQKQTKQHGSFIESLKVGSRVVTSAGLFGRIVAIDGAQVKLEIADKVVVRVLKRQIAGLEGNAEEAVTSANRGR